MKRPFPRLIGVLWTLAVPFAAEAGTATAQLSVTATVQTNCSVSGGTLDFGSYVTGQPDDLDAIGTITLVNCANLTVTVELDGGASGNVQSRRMANGNAQLAYQLYRDPARTQVWGQGNQAFQGQVLAPNTTLQIFGRIPGGQNVPSGTYSDTVNVTLSF